MSKIQMPSFDDFLAEMGRDRMLQWADEANAAPIELDTPLPFDQQTMTKLVTGISALNVKYMIAMLRDYHEWMTEQLAQRSLHLLK